ncbi:sirohydrochlorin chelatase [Alicyclobacillus ferrooxydans]|uniref:Cobalamin biosynthesis protein CbiX n=1 Tax=Alicyclobacillus ferrooxydans TaxID=471514 RepID=A0A0P9CD19_9BACL|nr:CbiX/SirB N-terminal domain-containing protein [Alicyclobacillus ferrooxydans]KPV40768.1 hypothetical protein AN477_20830 [Alicyclobacillus ferrooxydans]
MTKLDRDNGKSVAVSTTLILFVGHGTRAAAGVSEFLQFCRLVEQQILEQLGSEVCTHPKDRLNRASLRFECAFLEVCEPDLVTALIRGCTPDVSLVLVVPLFLFQAGHMKHDIPGLIQAAESQTGSVKIEVLPAIGVDPAFIEVAMTRLTEAGYVTKGEVESQAVLLLGRGNQDSSAQSDFDVLASRVRSQANVHESLFATGYLAGSGRDWRDALSSLVQTGVQAGARFVYIQPYLWFHGWLTEQLPKWVEDWRREAICDASLRDANQSAGASESGANEGAAKQLEIRIGEPLGVHQTLVSSVAERVLTVLVR